MLWILIGIFRFLRFLLLPSSAQVLCCSYSLSSGLILSFPRPFFLYSDLCSIYTWFIYELHTATDKIVLHTHIPFCVVVLMSEFGQPTLCIILFIALGLFLIIDLVFPAFKRNKQNIEY